MSCTKKLKRGDLASLRSSSRALMSNDRVPAGAVVRVLSVEPARTSDAPSMRYYLLEVVQGPEAGACARAFGFNLEPVAG